MKELESFFKLTPDRVLNAVERTQVRCTGFCMALNSYENRVFDVEVELPDNDEAQPPKSNSEKRRIIKFYRPGRWNEEQILEEHRFLHELKEREIPVVAPMVITPTGSTIDKEPDSGLFYAIFPKQGGRSPDELTAVQRREIGRLIARIHNVGAIRDAPSRLRLTPETYGIQNLEFLLRENWIPNELAPSYERVARELCTRSQERFKRSKLIRVHGDNHLGNLLYDRDRAFFVDFDDMVVAPAVQDLWLLLPGKLKDSRAELEDLIEGYELFRPFDRTEIELIEPLRGLRLIHYTTWIARRWEDPSFPKLFPHFNTPKYWREEFEQLEAVLSSIH